MAAENFYATAKKYHALRRKLLFLELAFYGAFLAGLQIFGFSRNLKTIALAVGNPWLQRSVYFFLFFQLTYFLSFPFRFYSHFRIEKKFGLSRQTSGAWAADEVKKYLLSLICFVPALVFLYGFVEIFPDRWWILAGTGWLFVSAFLAGIFPVFILPLFYPAKILPDSPLKEKLLALCRRSGVGVRNIFEIALSGKTEKANAALVGIGPSRRILLGDTLTKKYTEAEIEMVTAHEIGHHALHHIFRSFVFSGIATFFGFYLFHYFTPAITRLFSAEKLTDLGIFPALAFLFWSGDFFLLPVQNGLSRRHENEADRYALRLLPTHETFASLMNKLARQNMAEPDPAAWVEFIFYDHPSIERRIQNAQVFLKTLPKVSSSANMA